MSVQEEIRAFMRPFYDEILFYENNAEKQYDDATKELAELPDMTEELKNAVWKNNEAEYQKLRRKSDFYDQRRQFLEGVRERYAEEDNTVPIRPRNEMIQKVTENYWKKYFALAEELYKALKAAEEAAEGMDAWGNAANNFIRHLWNIGSVPEGERSSAPLPGDNGNARSLRKVIEGDMTIGYLYRKMEDREVKRRMNPAPAVVAEDEEA